MVTSGGENRRGDTEGTELRPEMGLDLYKETGVNERQVRTEATPSAWAHGNKGKMDQVSS